MDINNNYEQNNNNVDNGYPQINPNSTTNSEGFNNYQQPMSNNNNINLDYASNYTQTNNYEESSNVALGFVGALVGIIPGVIIWIILSQIGFIAGLAGYALLIGAFKGYSMLGKALDKKGVILCIIVSCVGIILADYLSLALVLHKEIKDIYDITLMDILINLPSFLAETSSALGSFALNLFIGFALSIWSCWKTVVAALLNK